MIQEASLQWRYTDGDLIMPWFVLPCLKWLKEQDTSNWSVFEYGCGYSTVWFRANCKEVQSVEHNEAWAKAMSVPCLSNNEQQGVDGDSYKLYVREVAKHYYDCIIVDGIAREECVKFCLPYLVPGGYLIIDNFDSENYDIKQTEDLLSDFKCMIHKQPTHSTWQTAVFQKSMK